MKFGPIHTSMWFQIKNIEDIKVENIGQNILMDDQLQYSFLS